MPQRASRFVLLLGLAYLAVVRCADDEAETCKADGSNAESCKKQGTAAAAEGLVDKYKDPAKCEEWAKRCECQVNKPFMHESCAKSCALHGDACKDTLDDCVKRVKAERERKGAKCGAKLWETCPSSCSKMIRHAKNKAKKEKEKKREKCRRMETPGGLQDLSISDMFGRIANGSWAAEHEPKVLSRDPWVVYFDKFLTHHQIDKMWEAMEELGAKFAPSEEIAGSGPVGKARRTSESLHCPSARCFTDPRLTEIHTVITNITGLHLNNHELPQLLKYEKGQYYVQHQDTSDDYGQAAHGNRIYTLFAYFSDIPDDAGGETHMPRLNLKMKPKKGAAVLWANVKAKNPRMVDQRSNHESLPVLDVPNGGVPYKKLAANFWLYGYDWRTHWRNGCMNVDAGY